MKITKFSYISFSVIFILFSTLFQSQIINCFLFNKEKIDIDIKEIIKKEMQKENLEDSNDCLVSKEEARIILQEKYNLNPDYIEIDNNIRFILGKCYPILYLPGLYASRMVATINCPVLKHDFLNFVKMRLFCGNTICEDETNEYE